MIFSLITSEGVGIVFFRVLRSVLNTRLLPFSVTGYSASASSATAK